MFGSVGNIIGQILSIVAIITGFISFQMKSSKRILFFHIITALIFSAHYFFIGAMTAMALNFIGAIKCVFYYIRNKRNSNSLVTPIFFTALVFVTSIITWDGWYSIFIMTGLVVNSIGLAFSNPQIIRKLNLLKSPLCLIYNLIVMSSGGVVFEIATFTSTIIGIIKNHDKAQVSQSEVNR